jgi:hypothetical protein
MAIEYRPLSSTVSLTGQDEHEAELTNLLKETINGLNRVVKQLEKITDEEIDKDEDSCI